MRIQSVLSLLAVACLVPSVASGQQKKVTCADNTIVTASEACASHGGVQKPGGLNRVGKQLNKAALDVKDEAKRTPKNVEKGAKTTGKNVSNAAGDVSEGAKKTVHPRTFKANCKDGTTWTGRSKGKACKDHGGVANWP